MILEFGVHGRNGSLQSWYGIGQSLLMLPSDLLGTAVQKLPVFDRYGDTDPTVRNIVVTFLTEIFINVMTALVCFKLLRQFAFNVNHSIAGILAFLLATTHLHYTQNMMENNYICLLTLAGFAFEYEWLRTGGPRALLIATGAFGLNLLTRITTGMDLLAGALFVLLVLWFEGKRGRALWNPCRMDGGRCRFRCSVSSGFSIACTSFIDLDLGPATTRAWWRRRPSRVDPSVGSNWPWTTPWHAGFVGALFAPEKSIFLFDPLIILVRWFCSSCIGGDWKQLCGRMRSPHV